MLAAARFGNRARAVGLACSPRMQTPSPTTKLLAGMPASKAAAERVFSALPLAVTVLRDSQGHLYSSIFEKETSPPRGPASATASASAPGGRPVAGKSPPGGSLAGQSGLVIFSHL
jgi:hypothetical protein